MDVPVTIITGYLGSGKTTLLRYVIEHATEKIAVVMNEFGELGIDAEMVKGKNVDVAELDGGCVCCSLTGEFEVAMKEILQTVKPDRIVVETTGTAEPDAILINIEEIPGVRLDGVITVVDADAMIRFPDLGYIGQMQIEMGDLLLITKTDLVNARQFKKVEASVRELNTRAPVLISSKGKVPLDVIFGLQTQKKLPEKKPRQPKGVDSFVFTTTKKLDRTAFEQFAGKLPEGVYRAKGFVRFGEGSFLFNYVAGRVGLESFPNKETSLVFIGSQAKKLEPEIKKQLEACLQE